MSFYPQPARTRAPCMSAQNGSSRERFQRTHSIHSLFFRRSLFCSSYGLTLCGSCENFYFYFTSPLKSWSTLITRRLDVPPRAGQEVFIPLPQHDILIS